MISASLNEAVPLSILAADGNVNLYGKITIYDSVGALVTTLNANHVANGLYSADFTPTTEGYYTYVSQLFFDSGRTIDAGYEKNGGLIDANSIKSNLLRILGLQHDNAVVDLQTYDGDDNLVSARLRTYDSKANADVAGATGLIHTYLITASYSGGLLTFYKLTRDS